jgi:hypothetical protein
MINFAKGTNSVTNDGLAMFEGFGTILIKTCYLNQIYFFVLLIALVLQPDLR